MHIEETVTDARVGSVRPKGCILKVQPIGFLMDLDEKCEIKKMLSKILIHATARANLPWMT